MVKLIGFELFFHDSHDDFELASGGEKIVAFLPFYHSFALGVILNTTLINGGTIVVMEQFDFIKYLGLNEKYKVYPSIQIWCIIVISSVEHQLGTRFE